MWSFFFFFNDTATSEVYTLSLHDALPIYRDGHIDLFVANDSMVEFVEHNKGNGKVEEVGLPSEVAVDIDGRTYAGMGVDFADYDNDGWPDIVVTDLANQRYALYRNNGDGSFTYASTTTGI